MYSLDFVALCRLFFGFTKWLVILGANVDLGSGALHSFYGDLVYSE